MNYLLRPANGPRPCCTPFPAEAGDGQYPGPLIFDQSGNLYGTTYQGGFGDGTVFELSPNPQGGWTENQLHRFSTDSDGYLPLAGVIFDPAGNLYSTTYNGGPNGGGTVFELSPSGRSWTSPRICFLLSRVAD